FISILLFSTFFNSKNPLFTLSLLITASLTIFIFFNSKVTHSTTFLSSLMSMASWILRKYIAIPLLSNTGCCIFTPTLISTLCHLPPLAILPWLIDTNNEQGKKISSYLLSSVLCTGMF
ncbi:hypothetical protein OTU49_001159, partial [Cherax quadricarinatus]